MANLGRGFGREPAYLLEEIIRNIENLATHYWHPPRQIGIEVGYRM